MGYQHNKYGTPARHVKHKSLQRAVRKQARVKHVTENKQPDVPTEETPRVRSVSAWLTLTAGLSAATVAHSLTFIYAGWQIGLTVLALKVFGAYVAHVANRMK